MTENKLPILITIPHCSTFVPAELRRLMMLRDWQIHRMCDPFTDVIFDIPKAYVVKAKISRLVADLNRAPDDIESEAKLSTAGVVASIDIDGNPIYKTPPSMDMIMERVTNYHDTFHDKIDELKSNVKFLIDGHSMRSAGPSTRPDAGQQRADIVLGNRDYTTCSRHMTRKIMRFFEDRGFSVQINNPYKGAYLIGSHCSRKGLPGIQIEVNEKLFMNEKLHRPYKRKLQELRKTMGLLVKEIAEGIETSGNPKKSVAQSALF
ncbi:N-formylglutamate amidohydrolase [Candidatus Peregrinibacteria bacterium]|nr:N-formylglutamate amidohydrolase [Candidatus Peregrinibacteria bacterium]